MNETLWFGMGNSTFVVMAVVEGNYCIHLLVVNTKIYIVH
jgi:hypothetical protein